MTALLELGAGIGPGDAAAATAARAQPAGPGRLGDLAGWLAATQGRFPPRQPNAVRCLVIGAVDDRVAELAVDSGVGIRAHDFGDGGDESTGSAAACRAGAGWVDDEVEAGADLLVLAVDGCTLAAAMVVGVLTGAEPVALLPRGADALDSDAWIRRAIRLRDGRRRIAAVRNRPDDLVAAIGRPALAAAVGVVLQSAVRRTPIVLDGTAAVAAALVCLDIQNRAADWWQVADSSDDVVHTRAVGALGCRPLLDLGTATGAGAAGILAVAVLRAATGWA